MTRIRPARDGDAEAIARIQIASWRAAYRAIMPADFLAGLNEAERAERWRTRVGSDASPDAPTYVAVDGAGTVVGFAHTGPLRDEDLPSDGRGEVYTLYVDPAAWRRGIGTALLAAIDEFW
ncbi:MAG TPA: GNAT family N-acetyltransferase, partial [Candidatus Limnocylindria bacterium]|nr:GNAT family N-acetyltransferase [Candidatus Limnocylindria bacterium]